jgi:ketosteroid isomerase-like protein
MGDDSRRAFLAGGAVAVSSAVFTPGASAQSNTGINDPKVVREIEEQFAGYDQALTNNDLAALNGYFFDSPTTVRYGNAENLYGFSEIQAYRSGVPSGVAIKRERTVITTYGNDFATVATLSRVRQPGKIGRTMQSWVRFPQGWRIVAAHVSTIDEPNK